VERSPLSRHWIVLSVATLMAIGTTAVALSRARRPSPAGAAGTTRAGVVAPEGTRIRVQVLNGTRVRGLARRATILLRDRGFDVVETGTTSGQTDTTLVLDLSGHPAWAKQIASLFPPARIQTRTDSSRYLDIAVVVGSTWRPPPESLNP
jgi:LytR cell envelope-related transcriptional attenuator